MYTTVLTNISWFNSCTHKQAYNLHFLTTIKVLYTILQLALFTYSGFSLAQNYSLSILLLEDPFC